MKKIKKVKFAYNYKKLRRKKCADDNIEVLQKDILKAINISGPTLSKISNADTISDKPYNTSIENIIKLAWYFGVKIDDIIEYEIEE